MLPLPNTDWVKQLKYAELTFCSKNNHRAKVELSGTQILVLTMILGIDLLSETESTAYSDETLMKFINMKRNPFQLELKE